jgi:hypothetical protein
MTCHVICNNIYYYCVCVYVCVCVCVCGYQMNKPVLCEKSSPRKSEVRATDYHKLLKDGLLQRGYKQILRSCRMGPDDTRGCQEHGFATTKTSDKYAQVRIEGTKYYCHIVSCMVNCGAAPEPGQEASHRCGNPRCIVPSHLVFEDGDTNKTRLCCHRYLGHHSTYICPHSPACIVSDPSCKKEFIC